VVDANDTEAVVDLGGGSWRHTQHVLVNLTCDRAGAHANTPIFLSESVPTFDIVDPLFDTTFTSILCGASGGSDGISDPALRALAQANYIGQFAPTYGALFAGSLAVAGIEHAAVVEDTTNAITKIFATDASWGANGQFLAVVEQALKDSWQGFGCQVRVLPVYNQRITVYATVPLVDPKYLSEQTDITSKIAAALRKYFDERPDWYTWRTNAIEGVIAGADRRILTCTSATAKDGANATLSQPSATISSSATSATHYYLADNAVRLTFSGP
jgi:hypothetical protein